MITPSTGQSLADCIQQTSLATANTALELARDPGNDLNTSVHKIRVSIKRLRATWHLLKYTVPAETLECADKRLKTANRQLSSARDSTILRETLQKFIEVPIGSLEPKRSVRPDWLSINELLLEELSIWRTLKFAGDDPDIKQGLKRIYKRARKSAKITAHRATQPPQRHRSRKWVKYLYYQLTLLKQCGLKGHKKMIGRLDSLGDSLGQEHDLFVLKQYAGSIELRDPETLLRKIEIETNQLQEKSDALIAKVFAGKPEKFL